MTLWVRIRVWNTICFIAYLKKTDLHSLKIRIMLIKRIKIIEFDSINTHTQSRALRRQSSETRTKARERGKSSWLHWRTLIVAYTYSSTNWARLHKSLDFILCAASQKYGGAFIYILWLLMLLLFFCWIYKYIYFPSYVC